MDVVAVATWMQNAGMAVAIVATFIALFTITLAIILLGLSWVIGHLLIFWYSVKGNTNKKES